MAALDPDDAKELIVVMKKATVLDPLNGATKIQQLEAVRAPPNGERNPIG
jgi:hypothetical protein